MQKKRAVVSIFTTRWGHQSIAEAAKDTLKNSGYKIYFNLIEAEKGTGYPYDFAYQFFPSATELPYKISGKGVFAKMGSNYLYKYYKDTVKKYINEQKPQVVVNTYLGFNRSIEALAKKNKFLFINIVADPRTFHPIWVSKFAYNLVFDKKAQKLCNQYTHNKDKCIPCGWFVREGFSKSSQKAVNVDALNFCIVGGSEGTYSVLKVIPSLIKNKKSVKITFICGNNKGLLESVKVIKKLFEYTESKIKIIPVGYKENINEYIRKADLVIGKAGPNLIFETAAAKKPILIISHMGGQEDGNLEIVKEYNLGFVEEKTSKLTKLLKEIIENPEILESFNKNIEEMAEYNKNSYKILAQLIKEKLKEGSV